ncbi:MAG TPA: hypothetical protein VMC10_14140 [Stellaceae bacterium]|nr:hypothetical protein [Stellaceae bacterium]
MDELTLSDYRRYQRYWAKHPPPHLLVAALLRQRVAKPSRGDLGELLAMAGPGGALRGGPR